ncbi:conserved hypothetical protein [Ixodes scapularis]|uniref:THO complex subunit 6 homolog n=1 Tax=Ixodes scapularis TaxID=6945 RepID=B7PZH3_IXOSC|nr:conserved hypothetical protein [Ixodes scapularis]|eukprot:XP_002405258.1 conserved hypothetical protein [Ixodes scapularis]
MDNLKKYYTTIYAQCFSPCQKYLVAASNYGEIAVFAASEFLSNEETEAEDHSRDPIYKFQAHSSSIFALVMSEDFLISGGNGEILAWDWSSLKKKSAKKSWSLSIPQGENIVQPEVNTLVLTGKICGGGPTLCIWHTRSLSPVTPLSDLKRPAHVAHFYSDMVVAAGGDPNVYHWSFSGDLKAKVETSASNLYSIALNEEAPYKVRHSALLASLPRFCLGLTLVPV